MKLLYPHCDVVVDIDPWIQDIMNKHENNLTGFLKVRRELSACREQWIKWLIEHDYQAGRDYWIYKQGYRFSSASLATAFISGVSK